MKNLLHTSDYKRFQQADDYSDHEVEKIRNKRFREIRKNKFKKNME
jgi:hypothetical protein